MAKILALSFSISPSNEYSGLVRARRTFVSKMMSLLCNTLSRFVIAFLPRSKLSFNYRTAVTKMEPKKIKYVTASTFSPSFCHEVMGPDVMILGFLKVEF